MNTLEPSSSGANYYGGHNLNMNPSAGVQDYKRNLHMYKMQQK